MANGSRKLSIEDIEKMGPSAVFMLVFDRLGGIEETVRGIRKIHTALAWIIVTAVITSALTLVLK